MNRKALAWVVAVAIAVSVSAVSRRRDKAPVTPPQPPPEMVVRTGDGPRLGAWTALAPQRGRPVGPAPGAARYFFQGQEPAGGSLAVTRLVSVALDGAGPDRVVLTVPGHGVIDPVRCSKEPRPACAVQIRFVDERDGGALLERTEIFVADGLAQEDLARAGGERRSLRGRGDGSAQLAGPAAMAPDGSFVGLVEWLPPARAGERARQRLIFRARAGEPAAEAELAKVPVEVIAWRQVAGALRAVVRGGWLLDQERTPPDELEIDPRTGARRALTGDVEEETQLSPDGRRRALCRQGREMAVVEIVERATSRTRTLMIPEADRPALDERCVRWVSPRHLTYVGLELAGFLDAETLKVNDALGSDAPGEIDFTSDFRFAVRPGEGGALIATVLRKE